MFVLEVQPADAVCIVDTELEVRLSMHLSPCTSLHAPLAMPPSPCHPRHATLVPARILTLSLPLPLPLTPTPYPLRWTSR